MSRIKIPSDFTTHDGTSINMTGWAIALMGIENAHIRGIKGQGVTIAIGDTGKNDHNDRLPHINEAYQGRYKTCDDEHGHGSHVLGIAYSVAPNATYLVGKVMGKDGTGSMRTLADFIDWSVEQGADVINLSLGSPSSTISIAVKSAIDRAFDKNVLIVCASGNEDSTVGYPARLEKVLAIGAIDHNKMDATFQNEGFELDFVAPGVQILSAWLGNETKYASGTSQATPYVTGYAALVRCAYHLKYGVYPTVVELIELIKSNSVDLNSIGFDTVTGHGLPRVDIEGFKLEEEDINDKDLVVTECFWTRIKILISSIFKIY